MYEEIVPLKPKGKWIMHRYMHFIWFQSCIKIFVILLDTSAAAQYKQWLKECYVETFDKILCCFSNSKQSISNQALSTAMKLIAMEGKYPIEPRDDVEYYYPIHRLKVKQI